MKKKRNKIFIALILFILAIIVSKLKINIWVSKIIFIISYITVGTEIIKKALRNIKRGKVFDENFLMTVATIGAFLIGEFPEAVAVMLFYQIGELFQSYAVDKSRRSIAELMDIRPDYANIEKNNKLEKENPNKVKIGDIIVVKPGEKIPLDGIVIDGNSMIDTKSLTGESVPKSVGINDEVLSGCINGEGILKIKVTKEFGESTVTKILELVENASSNKAKSENFITKFSRYYTPIVVVVAVFLAIIPPIITNTEFTDWIYRALSFLVVSCPCALVISIPLSFFGGIGGASKQGILIKGSNYLEALSKSEIAVFDKTGTLTKGVFEVQKINAINISKDELLEYAAYAENYSNHPIAISIKSKFGKNIDELKILDTKEIAGHGICATVKGKEVLIGNQKLMEKNNIVFNKCNEVGTILYIAIDKKYSGFILISDEIKNDSEVAIRDLKKNGINKIVMLTGDKKEVANEVGKKLTIKDIYYELLPENKVEKVTNLLNQKSKGRTLFFVGDGVNDSPVLALSDIGIAMGALGSDSAIEAADIVIMNDEPSKIVDAIKISKKTMRIVKENIIFAILIKILVLILVAIGMSNMWWAVFADVGVSILAILNALRMLKSIRK